MSGRVSTSHLQRRAYVYVRQSTAAQVHEHVESTKRQYGLVDRAVALGWCREQVEVVDEDQGRSGSTAEGRNGFARLAHEVAHGRVGAVLAIEVSRLARSSQDWQRLLSLCAVARVLVVDEQSVYDPSQHDDKLLLDLKGAMSEQELHWLRLRLAGGRLNKARRGEAYVHPPAGYVWGEHGLEQDPDEAVRRAVQLLFDRFAVEPSARALMRWARDSGFRMPTRDRTTGHVSWRVLGHVRLGDILHNPVYAGVYVFGRRPTKQALVGGIVKKVRVRLDDRSEWPVGIDGAHPGYITWETYMSNVNKLRSNRSRATSSGPPREGPALLAGLLLCGRCGRRMTPHYESLEQAWQTRLEQARYEARVAERRFMAVDPDNRVVARTLEAHWEQRLRDLAAVERQYDDARKAQKVALSDEDRRRIRELARDLPVVWRSATTSVADKKAMFRIAIEAIAAQPVDVPRRATKLEVQWQGGTTTDLLIPRMRPGEYRQISEDIVDRIRERAAAGIHDEDIAEELNRDGLRNKEGQPWNLDNIRTLRCRRRIPRVAPERVRMPPLPAQDEAGRYSVPGLAARMGVAESTNHRWIHLGLVPAVRCDYGTHRSAFWLSLDEDVEARLRVYRRGDRAKTPNR